MIFQILFVAALFLIVVLALNIELLIIPNAIALSLAAGSLILGLGILAAGRFRSGSIPSREGTTESAGAAEVAPRRSTACPSGIAGSLYVLIATGVFLLQAIGYLASK